MRGKVCSSGADVQQGYPSVSLSREDLPLRRDAELRPGEGERQPSVMSEGLPKTVG